MTLPRATGHWIAAIVVLALGVVLTWVLARQQIRTDRVLIQARLDEASHAATDALARRVRAYDEIVAGLRDLFLIDPGLDWRGFERVARERDLQRQRPEIRNLTFTRRVPAAQLPAYEQRLKAQARDRGLAVAGDVVRPTFARADYYVIECVWPREEGEGLWGQDVNARPNRLAALLAARVSGEPVISAPVELPGQPGRREAFTLRYPVFGDDSAAEDRAPHFIGTVAIAVDARQMLDGLRADGFLSGLVLRLLDDGAVGAEPPPAALLVAQSGDMSGLRGATPGPVVRQLQVRGRQWRLEYVATRPMLSRTERLLPRWIGGLGALLSLLLAATVGLLARQRTLALAQARKSDLALRGSEQRLRAMFEQNAVGVALIDMQTERFERVNQMFCNLVGYSSEELVRMDVRAISHPRDYPANLALREQLRRGEVSAFHMEKRLVRKDGSPVWIDLTVAPVLRDGQEPRHNVGVIQDITERMRMRENLHQSEARLRTVLDHLPVGVVLQQRDGTIMFRNRRFVEITGYDADTLVHGADWWGRAWPDAGARDEARARWQRHRDAADGRAGAIEWDEYEIRRADGTPCAVGISGVLLADALLFIVEDLSAHKAAADEIDYLAHYDPLTGLANRKLLLERLRRPAPAGAPSERGGAVLVLDLDHFKTLNDTLGHVRGDALLRQVAERLRACAAPGNMLARHGDDEFVIVLATPATEDASAHARELGERILAALRAPFMLDGEPYHTTASVGVALFEGALAPETLLQQADLAMYQAKAAGRDTLCFYDPALQAQAQARVGLERDLRTALEHGQLELYYQAQVRGAAVIGAEALLRWRHPQHGFIAPTQFIALAEETGLILPIGRWVLDTACRQLAEWATEPRLAGLKLAVNISPRQFYQLDFVAQVMAALARAGADARRLELELTEGLLLQDVEGTIAKMAQLKACGVEFSLDDFGTGYSSLAYLKRLPLSQLKIDQSFVRDVLIDPNDAAIARTIIALAASLGLQVIAEGVETEAQRALLQHYGCDTWQGYLFGKPVPVADFMGSVRVS